MSHLSELKDIYKVYHMGEETVHALDGISLTNTITPSGLGRTKEEQVNNLVGILDAGFVPEDCC